MDGQGKSEDDISSISFVLAKQMLKYDPSKGMYPGDDKMRAYTQKHKKCRISGDNDDGHST